MTKAEQRALEAYPNVEQPVWDESYPKTLFVRHTERNAFIKGYEQADKDLGLTWKDIKKISRILDIMVDDDFKGEIPEEWGEEEYYEEVLRRFKKAKEE